MKVRKKPLTVDAVQWTGDWAALQEWVTEVSVENNAADGRVVAEAHGPDMECDCRVGGSSVAGALHVMIRTLEGDLIVPGGWWVIRGVKGEYYPCRPDIFDETYDIVHEAPAPRLVLVVAYNSNVAREYVQAQVTADSSVGQRRGSQLDVVIDDTRYAYVSEPGRMRGWTPDEIHIIGGSSKRRDYAALLEEVHRYTALLPNLQVKHVAL